MLCINSVPGCWFIYWISDPFSAGLPSSFHVDSVSKLSPARCPAPWWQYYRRFQCIGRVVVHCWSCLSMIWCHAYRLSSILELLSACCFRMSQCVAEIADSLQVPAIIGHLINPSTSVAWSVMSLLCWVVIVSPWWVSSFMLLLSTVHNLYWSWWIYHVLGGLWGFLDLNGDFYGLGKGHHLKKVPWGQLHCW